MTAFDEAWDLAKVDFRLDRPDKTAMGYSTSYLNNYKYRVPTGYDSEGNLTYSPKDRMIRDTSFVRLPTYKYGERGDQTPSSIENKTAQRIMDTIVHEAMHDADTRIGGPARDASGSTKKPTFGNRRDLYSGKREPINLDFITPTTRDENFAAETMAYIGEYPDRPDIANIRIMNHPDVAPSDVKWMYDKLPATPYSSSYWKPKKITPKTMKRASRPSIERDDEGNIINPFREDFVVPKSEQIRRNLVNALRDMAMTRMTQSGEFLESPETSQATWQRKRNRPNPKQVKMAERETSKARNAINRYWKKIEAGDEPLPNSFEDLPDKIKQLVGQQQIRSIVGEQRGLGSDMKDLGDPHDIAYRKASRVMSDPSWENMPLEERENHLREYLNFVQTHLKPAREDRYGNLGGIPIGESYGQDRVWISDELFGTEPDMDKIRQEGYDDLQDWKDNQGSYTASYPRLNIYQNLLDEFNLGGYYDERTHSDLEQMLHDARGDWKKTTPGKIYEITPRDISNRAKDVL
jgi:hypothetical protein